MCGLAGIFNFSEQPVEAPLLRAMASMIAHRGPDSEGYHIDSYVGLGHRRLAIIDLSPRGHQPMLSRDSRYALVFNGEIYNFRELRSELVARGCSFDSQSDTEVVLYGYAEYGTALFEKLNGMFALAIWDTKDRTLTLARDRYGTKPLYVTRVGDSLLFASEIKAFFPFPNFEVAVDRAGFAQYFNFQNFFDTHTLFAGVELFPAGFYQQISIRGGAHAKRERFADLSFQEPGHLESEVTYLETLDHLFRDAVRSQLVSDVELGAYLSGGLDSGAITATASSVLPTLKTFTCGFDLHSASGMELRCDERETAEHLSYLYKTEHYEIVLKAGDMERVMPKLVWHLEEPRVGQSYPSYYAAQLASKFVKVVLSGAGGDEIFAGYPWRYYRSAGSQSFEEYSRKHFSFWQRSFPPHLIQPALKPFAPDFNEDEAIAAFRQVFSGVSCEPSRPEDYVNLSLYFEAKTFLNGLLLVEDKLSMAHGLEARVPFLDNRLVEFACKLPVRMKLGNLKSVARVNENDPAPKSDQFYKRHQDGKLILRKMLRQFFPAEVSQREKQGFSPPDDAWRRGDSIGYIARKLLHGKPKLYDFLDRKIIEPLVREHVDGQENRRLLVWSLLYFENWIEQFLARPKSELTGVATL